MAEIATNSDPTTTIDTHDLAREYRNLQGERSLIEQRWDKIERFYDPLGSGGRGYVAMGEGQIEMVRAAEPWDSTAIDATEKLAASIHGSVTSPAIRWFKMKWRSDELANDTESAKWLEDASEAVFRALMDSDFNTEIASADNDLVRYANCFICMEAADEDEWKGLDFEAVMVRDGYFREDSRGGLERWFRRLYWTPVQVMDLCTRRGWKCPDDILKKAKLPQQGNERMEYVFCVFRRPEAERKLGHAHERNRAKAKARRALREYGQRMPKEGEQPPADPGPDDVTYPLAPHLRSFGGVYFRADTGEKLGEECGYYDRPVFFTRWAKTAGSKWGHGPTFTLLPTVQTLNAIVEAEYQALAVMVQPPLEVEERGLIGNLNIGPAGINVVRKKGTLTPLNLGTRLDASGTRANDLRQQIRQGLHWDELTLKDSPAMTLGEVQIRYELMNRVMGATLARIESDELGPIVKGGLGHMFRAGQLPELPDKVKRAYENKAPDFDVEYLGPLARAQRTDEVASIERALAFDQSILKDGIPRAVAAVRATVNFAKAIRRHHQLLGVPADLMNSEKEVDAKMNEFDAQEQAAAKAAQDKAEGEAATAHAQAASLTAQAQGTGPVSAQPEPMVSPSFGPVQPFAQPGPGM